MTVLEAIILGIIQGLTEFLPISSSGHIELGTVLLGLNTEENLIFSLAVHAATALSTIIIFRRDIFLLISGLLKFKWNKETTFVAKILLSIVPVGIVGILFEDQISTLFSGNVLLVGSMLITTGIILSLSQTVKDPNRSISFIAALIIGISQAIAIFPGISRSGATIGTALLLKINKEEAARFSFLMVLIPIMGAALLKLKDYLENPELVEGISAVSITSGFIAALIAGLLACQWMLKIVKKGKLLYFAIYCFAIGSIAIISQLL